MSATPNAADRGRHKTAQQLRQALATLQSQSNKVTISAVAKLAGVTPALVHNSYPDIAERIRAVSGKGVRAQRDAKTEKLKQEHERNRELRAEIAGVKQELAKVASLNLTLLSRIAILSAALDGKVTPLDLERGKATKD
ncbi:TetR family transcriptional regulator [Bordetella sp. 15P40C-2]|uniref:TetR family transcriptional regulator n=1 Tax=Bordetella sp. 15P40C-2 TaxID=2572246 RepID=UPI0019237E91|nr:TetR family transcriptional regulator [Bordetella sp. 15P40C-2]